MKILTLLFMCCATLYAADTTNPPTVVFGPPRNIVAGHGDVGQFILQTVIKFGGAPITTNGLPHISDQWSYEDQPGAIVIEVTQQQSPAVDAFLIQSFGQPTGRHDGQSDIYQLTTNGCTIGFMVEHGVTYIPITRPNRKD